MTPHQGVEINIMTLHQGVEINIMTPYQGVQTPFFYFHCDIIVSQWEMIVFNSTRLNNDHVKWPQINYNLLSVCCFSLDNLHFNFEIKFFVDVKIVQYRTKKLNILWPKYKYTYNTIYKDNKWG
jgi:hypothetical protein